MFGTHPTPCSLLQPFDPADRPGIAQAYNELGTLDQSECHLDHLLQGFLQYAVRVFQASQGFIWLRAPGQHRLSIRATEAGRGTSGTTDLADREAVVRLAMARSGSFFLSPGGRSDRAATAHNQAGPVLLLGPIESHGDRIGVVELRLNAALEGEQDAERSGVLREWLDHLTDCLSRGIERRFQGNLAPLQPALVNLAATREEIESYKRAILVSLEITLNSYSGWNFGSLNNNRIFTKTVQELLDANGLRVECPECGAAAILRCQPAGNARTGVFLYDHYLPGGRTFHGGPTTFPKLRLVAKPPRRLSRPGSRQT